VSSCTFSVTLDERRLKCKNKRLSINLEINECDLKVALSCVESATKLYNNQAEIVSSSCNYYRRPQLDH
jgi:hypothetical protein